ncbi:hypothetical protein C1H46_035035 [Malus baccata]|uniref:Uncharacterized protein n=1 Tax=Malus baccata TaxID=106549 RepID=A0A540KYY5_MALBA|nr:hypothetical protein C1H46_035035 [Malus baccata]
MWCFLVHVKIFFCLRPFRRSRRGGRGGGGKLKLERAAGVNEHVINKVLGSVAYDLEWNNGTSFFYTLDSARECRTVQVEVGILRPDWLDGAKYLGRRHVDGGFLCNVWEKADFITYYEDVDTKRPVHWIFYTGREAHVMTFEVGAALEDAKWQAPVYCFDKKKTDTLVPEAEAEAEFSITGASIDWRSMRNQIF